MQVLVAALVACGVNLAIVLFLQKRYQPPILRVVVFAYLATVTLRYLVAVFLWLNHGDQGFATMFWGDSGTYDGLGAEVANGWAHGGGSSLWAETLEGKANRGFIYFVAVIYYVFGRNPLLVQFLNGIIGALTPIIIFEIGLLLYNERVAARAMLFTAFFPQMIFWSAAMYKDAAVMFFIALSMWSVLRLKLRFRLLDLLIYLGASAALIWLRFYIFYVLAVATIAGFWVTQRRSLLFGLITQIFAVAGMLTLLLMTPVGQEMISQSRYLDLQQLQSSRSDLAARAESGFAVDADVSTVPGLLHLLPLGVAYLLFAPFPWMVGNLRQVLALPDILVWYALMPALIRGLLSALRHHLKQAIPILVFTTALTLAYGAFLGNAGTAYRQRTQIMMFYFLFIADGLEKRRVDIEEQERSLDPARRVAI